MDSAEIYSQVAARYSAAAHSTSASYSNTVARAFGYSDKELTSIPTEANLGLSCGNPLVTATLREGETVVDLGSGAGFDVFLSAEKVGAAGNVIGVDMNTDMISKAEKLKSESGKTNVEFLHARITDIPLPAGTVDCIISNCVINLVPESEKQTVFHEMFRLLKPGGRVAVSDILAKKLLPEDIRESAALYVDCIAGASQIAEYEAYLKAAGFRNILITDTESDLNIYREADSSCCCGPADKKSDSEQKEKHPHMEGIDMNHWVGSYKVYAVKD